MHGDSLRGDSPTDHRKNVLNNLKVILFGQLAGKGIPKYVGNRTVVYLLPTNRLTNQTNNTVKPIGGIIMHIAVDIMINLLFIL